MYKGVEPTTPEERYKKPVNFLWTTEADVYPLKILPTIFDLDGQGIRYPNILAITAAGQILDYVASFYGGIGRVDFIDFKPGQNIYVADKLANICRYNTPEEFKQHMFDRDIDEVIGDLDHAVMFFPELFRYPETYDIDVRELARFFVCKRDASYDERFSQEFLTPYNMRHLFLEHNIWYRSLRSSAMNGVFHFSCGKIEDFSPIVKDGYHVVYLSDVHAWAERRKLAHNLLDLVTPGGWFESAFFGADCLGFVEYEKRDKEFRRYVEGLGKFRLEFLFSERTMKVERQVRRLLGVRGPDWRKFYEKGPGGLPEKQQVPFVGQRLSY